MGVVSVPNVVPQMDLFRGIVDPPAEIMPLCACGLSEKNRIHNKRKHVPGYHAFEGESYGARFDRRNPQVMELLARLTRRARARSGGQVVGFRMVWEMARWMYLRATRDAESQWKLNNNLQYWYSRELMVRYADLAGVFHTRSRAEKKAA